MPLPQPVLDHIAAQGWGQVARTEPVGGGCINDGRVLTTGAGPRLFLKLNRSAPPDMFEREADGLKAMGQAEGAPRVPRPYLAGPDFLLLEYLAPEPKAADYWPVLGQQLAHLHRHTARQFGFDHDNYIGSTPQPNPREASGHRFFAEHRLRYQGRLAMKRGLLDETDWRKLLILANRLPQLIPEQPASLIHGDLWSGNIITGPGGRACLIDPAAYYGWAEADLAMTVLFGHLPKSFYEAYEDVRPLAAGYRERFDVYNLYHLLNHLNLFGSSYRPAVQEILSRYG